MLTPPQYSDRIDTADSVTVYTRPIDTGHWHGLDIARSCPPTAAATTTTVRSVRRTTGVHKSWSRRWAHDYR